jgi:hypothetical protein
MRQLCLSSLLLLLICLLTTACVVQVRPIPVLEVHPLEVKLHH